MITRLDSKRTAEIVMDICRYKENKGMRLQTVLPTFFL